MTAATAIAGLVLAGGRSTRMGGEDKALLAIGGRRLVDRVLARLAPQVCRVAISANGDPRRFGQLGIPILADPLPGGLGPLAGVLAGLEWAATLPGVTGLVTVATDTPFLPSDLVDRLAAGRSGEGSLTVAASGDRIHPVDALWPVAAAADLRHYLQAGETYKATRFIEKFGYSAVSFDPVALPGGAVDPFFNINTRDDLATAARLLGETAP
ncbi:MAG: molybdenum cofactor guanylyltransferase MobA [Rhizobiaceae bacterium]|nr:MAG: molybdenum cofactor guanylyltransferase MobA [Rhizobiaceae bacterium]CAG1010501.1 molybdenum cofactor guanylyltransferase [Rhizobiaceae bacterium]